MFKNIELYARRYTIALLLFLSTAIAITFASRLTKPIINLSTKLTLEFIVKPIVPLYLAWLVLMVRIYLLPLLVGHTYLGKFAFLFNQIVCGLETKIKRFIIYRVVYGMK